MLKLVLGIAGSGKTSRILGEITENAKLGQAGQYLIVPEQYSHEAERELCAAGGDEICLYAEVLSFSRLAVRVAQEAGTGGRVSVDNAGRLLCMSLALDKVGSGLKLYSAASRKTELLSGLFAAVEELKAAQIDPKLLESAASQAGGTLSDKLSDLLLCLEAYNAVLSQGRADPTDRLVRLAETLDCSSVGEGHIYIDGFTDFTGAEMLVIEAIIKKGADLTVCLTCDGLDSAGEQFEPSRKAAFALLRLAEKHGVAAETEASSADSGKSGTLRFFDEHLFAYTFETRPAEGCVSLFTCGSLRDECELACARCIELVRSTGCRWRDIAVAVRGFEDYAAPLEDIFSLYGVPLITASRESILQKNAPAAIFAAFEVIFGGWTLSDVLTYMKTGLTGLGGDECDDLERYAALWNIRGSYWYRAAGFTMHPDGYGAPWDDDARARLARIDSARTRLTAPLFRLSKRGEASKTAVQQAQALADFLEEIGFASSLSDRAEKLEAAGLMQLSAETGQLWEIIVRALEQFAKLVPEVHAGAQQRPASIILGGQV
ncbi:MAG: ATP-dependent nuclease subunit B, partial [Clostridia bacterium]|nr:ATP-dependent nuclease subunit B [Clostridia bacterium]